MNALAQRPSKRPPLQRLRLLAALPPHGDGEPMSSHAVAERLNISINAAYRLLARCATAGHIARVGNGLYTLPAREVRS